MKLESAEPLFSERECTFLVEFMLHVCESHYMKKAFCYIANLKLTSNPSLMPIKTSQVLH